MKWMTVAVACLAWLLGAAGPAGATTELTRVATRDIDVLGYTAPMPHFWVEQAPETTMRLAQFSVPGPDGETGEAEVFYFGKVGTAAGNIARWEAQFATPDGKPVKASVERLTVAGMPVSIAELRGSYARGVGMGPIGAFKPNQILLAAVIETPKGNVIIQLHGNAPVVEANREAFQEMVRGFH